MHSQIILVTHNKLQITISAFLQMKSLPFHLKKWQCTNSQTQFRKKNANDEYSMLVVNRLMASINTSAKVTGGSEELLQFDFQLICMSRPEMIWRHIKGAEQRWQSYQMTRFKWEVTILLMVSPVILKIKEKGEVSQVYFYSALEQHDLGWEWHRKLYVHLTVILYDKRVLCLWQLGGRAPCERRDVLMDEHLATKTLSSLSN